MKQKIFFLLLIIVSFITCIEKEDSAPKGFVEIDNIVINDALYTEITCEVKANGTIETVLFEYSLDPNFRTYEQTEGEPLQDKYSGILTALQENSTYYVRCRVQNKYSSCVSNLQSFKTKPFTTPKVCTDSASNITLHSATLYGTLEHRGTNVFPEVGFCFAKHKEVTIDDSCIIGSIDNQGHYHIDLTELEKNVFYYFRAYATNSVGTSYGEEIAVYTCGKPTVTTLEVTDISHTSATCGGQVTDDGGKNVTERGICYSTSKNPTISSNKVTSGSGLGSFTCNLTNLADATTYYVRAYAINSKGISYGEEKYFVTTINPNRVIYYTAYQKLQETTDYTVHGIQTNSFGASIISHEFSNRQGKIVFDRELTYIGYSAFSGCGLTSVNIPNSVTTIGEWAFSSSGLTSIDIPESVTSIGENAFYYCGSLTSITLPKGITSIEEGVFYGCTSLMSIDIPEGITSIGDCAFQECSSLTSINIPYGVKSIGYKAFCECGSLISIDIPNTVQTIGTRAFQSCLSSTSVTIGKAVWSIGDYGFVNCANLTSIRCYAVSPPACGNNVFHYVPKNIPVYVPAQSVSSYKSREDWKYFNIQAISE